MAGTRGPRKRKLSPKALRGNREACPSGKQRFKDEIEAKIVLGQNPGRARTHSGKDPVDYYWCKDCKGFHLTSKKKRRR